MINKVEKFIEQYNMIQKGDLVVAGISGGADSVCMLLQICEYRKIKDFSIQVVHVNHMIREEAWEDSDYVKELCVQQNVQFKEYKEDVLTYAQQNGLSTEEAGRLIRYKAFRECIEQNGGIGKIAVAHNQNDVAETVLFNIFRGTGIEGLCSLTPVNGNIIRPLLCLSREEIEEYLNSVEVEYKTDRTNLENEYARNKIRNVILPYVDDNICQNSYEHIANMSQKMLDIKEYLRKQVAQQYEQIVAVKDGAHCIDLHALANTDKVMKQEIVLSIFDKITTGRKDISELHVNSVLDLVDKNGEKKIDLPYNLEAIKKYDELIIRKKEQTSENEIAFDITKEGIYELGKGWILKASFVTDAQIENIPSNLYTKWFDYDKISTCMRVRKREESDYLTINKELSRKSLKKYFIDEKISREDRDDLLVVADENHIIWVVGYRISEYYKVTKDTKKIIELNVYQEE